MSWALFHFSRRGAARYLSHLDTARALQRTFARAGVQLALSQGMRPKPRLSLGLALPVGVAGLHELAALELAEGQGDDAADLLARLRAAAPEGVLPLAVEMTEQRLRLEPLSADYECLLALDPDLAEAAAAEFSQAAAVPVERVSPKGRRTIDLKLSVSTVSAEAAEDVVRLRFTVRQRTDGTAKPEEVAREVARRAGSPDPVLQITRLQVAYNGLPLGARPRE
jgi:radical SAM-linked protein